MCNFRFTRGINFSYQITLHNICFDQGILEHLLTSQNSDSKSLFLISFAFSYVVHDICVQNGVRTSNLPVDVHVFNTSSLVPWLLLNVLMLRQGSKKQAKAEVACVECLDWAMVKSLKTGNERARKRRCGKRGLGLQGRDEFKLRLLRAKKSRS